MYMMHGVIIRYLIMMVMKLLHQHILVLLIHLDIEDIIMMRKRDYFGYPQGIIRQNFAGSLVLMK